MAGRTVIGCDGVFGARVREEVDDSYAPATKNLNFVIFVNKPSSRPIPLIAKVPVNKLNMVINTIDYYKVVGCVCV